MKQKSSQDLWQKRCAFVLGILAVGLAVTTSITSTRWVGTVFPGFFVLDNQVVASISLPHWSVATNQHLYQHAVIAVNGQLVFSSAQLYAVVRQIPLGSPVTYTLEKDGRTLPITLPTQLFTLKDHFFLFSTYLFTGVATIAIGLGVWVLTLRSPAGLALLVLSFSLGIFFLTAVDLYSPSWFFRLHVVSEACLGAGFIHLTLVFPVDRLRHWRAWTLVIPYLFSLTLSVAYQVFLYQPTAYSHIHSLCESYAGLSGLPFLANVIWQYWTTVSHLTRQRIRVIFLGFLGAFAIPAGLALLSSFSGGEVAVNYSVFTIFIFPLSLGYAIVKHDLFEIDALLKRGTYYFTLTTVLALLHVTFVSLLNLTFHSADVAQSPLFSLLFTLAAVLLLNPLKDRVQHIVDRLFFRLSYDAKKVLQTTSEALASTLRLDEILPLVWGTISETMGIIQGGVLLFNRNRQQYVTVYPHTDTESALPTNHPLIQRLQQHREHGLSRYNVRDEEGEPGSSLDDEATFGALNAQLLVPLNLKGELLGLVALGQKESGHFFSSDDRDFLFTLANQSALSISNALSYEEITKLNVGLEHKVEERTQQLAHTNLELQQSFSKLEQTYRDLEQSQGNLVRAEKMATLGRLTAGIAHEMNTPLGASLNSLTSLDELIREYENSLGDQEVTEDDHREIASEMHDIVRSTQQWIEKASAHIRSLKLHTRDLQQGHERMFSVAQTIEDTAILLSHRLRLSQCKLTIACTISEPMIYGDPGKLGQVLTNLINNAIDAYKEAGKSEGEINIVVSKEDGNLEIHVRDQGCGIPTEKLDKIFEELFSTKAIGEGTGLGLPISRDIISNFFGGTLQVESELGKGSTFSIRFPYRRTADRRIVQSTLYSPFADEEQAGVPQRAA